MTAPIDRPASTGAAGQLHAQDLRDYVNQIAAALAIPAHAVNHEISDTATAYLALDTKHANHPERDLMLTWHERTGWAVATEPIAPNDRPVVLAHLPGGPLPEPAAVARFTHRTLRTPAEPGGPAP